MLREELLQLRIKSYKENITPEWNMVQLDKVYKTLKSGKLPDQLGFVNFYIVFMFWFI